MRSTEAANGTALVDCSADDRRKLRFCHPLHSLLTWIVAARLTLTLFRLFISDTQKNRNAIFNSNFASRDTFCWVDFTCVHGWKWMGKRDLVGIEFFGTIFSCGEFARGYKYPKSHPVYHIDCRSLFLNLLLHMPDALCSQISLLYVLRQPKIGITMRSTEAAYRMALVDRSADDRRKLRFYHPLHSLLTWNVAARLTLTLSGIKVAINTSSLHTTAC